MNTKIKNDKQYHLHKIGYEYIQIWEKKSIHELKQEVELLKSKIKIIPGKSGTVKASMTKVLKNLETYLKIRIKDEKTPEK